VRPEGAWRSDGALPSTSTLLINIQVVSPAFQHTSSFIAAKICSEQEGKRRRGEYEAAKRKEAASKQAQENKRLRSASHNQDPTVARMDGEGLLASGYAGGGRPYPTRSSRVPTRAPVGTGPFSIKSQRASAERRLKRADCIFVLATPYS
jgi:hypothetical protein